MFSKDVDVSAKEINCQLSLISNVESSCVIDGLRLGLHKVVRISSKTNSSSTVVVCGVFQLIFVVIVLDAGNSDLLDQALTTALKAIAVSEGATLFPYSMSPQGLHLKRDEVHSSSFENSDENPVQFLDAEKMVVTGTATRNAYTSRTKFESSQRMSITPASKEIVGSSAKLLNNSDQEEIIYFKNLLANFPAECNVAANISDISPHLCFTCLLHLENENGLRLQGFPNLDNLSIFLPHDAEPELLSGTF
ncbi:hypothetical protein KIW84_063566 [Lathyrus oleraceus]|uniref:Condensin complex subunit 2 n=1 Tax=Pisum sativum TaxID=3888 RepID=A0A9D5A7F4_PEA|nr:hypothetical protein KIW84_063566 [Pisum sativum]